MKSETIGAIAAALSNAQASMSNATKSGTNPHLKSSYSDLADVWEACRVVLGENKLAVFQPTCICDGVPCVETMLVHGSGEWISGTMPIKNEKNTPQAFGSALTYARRQALSAMVGISPSDDDGEAAMSRDVSPMAAVLAKSEKAAMVGYAPPAILSTTDGEGPYRIHSLTPAEGNRPARVKLVDAGGAIREVVSWQDETIQTAEAAFDGGGWVTVAVKEKQGGPKRDNPGERWPSSFELTEITSVESGDNAAQAPVPAGAPLGSPVMVPGEQAAPATAVSLEDLPF
jgi:hypothetical protein